MYQVPHFCTATCLSFRPPFTSPEDILCFRVRGVNSNPNVPAFGLLFHLLLFYPRLFHLSLFSLRFHLGPFRRYFAPA